MFAKISKLMSISKSSYIDFSTLPKIFFLIIFLKRFLINHYKLVPFILYLQTQ